MPNYAIVRGSTSSPTVFESRSYNKSTGETRMYRRVFSGVTGGSALDAYDACAAEFASLKASGYYDSLEMSPIDDNTRWSLTGTMADETTTHVIELIGQDMTQDSRLSPVFITKISAKKASMILNLIKELEEKPTKSYASDYSNATGRVSEIADLAGLAMQPIACNSLTTGLPPRIRSLIMASRFAKPLLCRCRLIIPSFITTWEKYLQQPS